MLDWKYILLHHSLTKDSKTVSWQAIRRYHIQTLGWKDIGYHFGIELMESDYEVIIGRPLTMVGCHCKGMNKKAIGVCCMGNYDITTPDPEMLKILITRLINPLMALFDIPVEHIKGHRDFANKSCPGEQFDLEGFRKMIC
jgi:N-acetylmuramoyl-L-alanine amidase